MGESRSAILAFVFLASVWPSSATAVNVTLDYTYDTSGLFAPGSAARASLQAAADFYSQILGDTLVPVTVPDAFVSQFSTGIVSWDLSLTHPSTGEQFGISEASIAADEYRIYVGGFSLDGDTAGQGGFGDWNRYSNGGGFTQAEFNQYVQIRDTFQNAASTRGQSSGFATWGGSISFDTDANQNWHFSHLTPPPDNTTDMYSVAIHEIGHVLGLGSSDEWNSFVAGAGDEAYFTGAAATTAYGGSVPLAFYKVGSLLYADPAHWRLETESVAFGSSTVQEAAMSPSITDGTRKRLTALDAAALTDIGWTVIPPIILPGDYNGSGIVDAADYTVWRNNFGSAQSLLNDDSPGVDNDDYTRWKTHFGSTSDPGGGSFTDESPAVPEPSVCLLVFTGIVVLLRRRQRLPIRGTGARRLIYSASFAAPLPTY